ncbi:MAG: phage holin family protein [Opitutaceae bacterium]|nr:phage holin family protein [Opitutaceae bacterium]
MAVFFKRGLVSAFGVFLGSSMLPGISYEDSGSLVLAVLLLSVFSSVLKPILVLFALPFVVMTMGLGLLFINALLFLFASYLVDGFHVESFGYAFLGAFIITMLNLFFNAWINDGRSKGRVTVNGGDRSKGKPGDSKTVRQGPGQTRGIVENEDVIDI